MRSRRVGRGSRLVGLVVTAAALQASAAPADLATPPGAGRTASPGDAPRVASAAAPTPLVVGKGRLLAELALEASDRPEGDGPARLGQWTAVVPRLVYGVTRRCQVGASTRLAAVRAVDHIDHPYRHITGFERQPIGVFGGAFAELRCAGQHAGLHAVYGTARPGAFGRGPFAEARYRASQHSRHLKRAVALHLPLRLGTRAVTVSATPGVNVHTRAYSSGDEGGPYVSLQLPVDVHFAVGPATAGLHAGVWRASGEDLYPLYASLAAGRGATIVTLAAGLRIREREWWYPVERDAFVGLSVGASLDLGRRPPP